MTTKVKESQKQSMINYILKLNHEDLLEVITIFKTNKDTKFRQLIDITAVDYPEKNKRFKIVYLFLSHKFNQRIIVKLFTLMRMKSFFFNKNISIC